MSRRNGENHYLSEETRDKHLEKIKKNWSNPEYRQHMSDVHKGQKRSVEARKKQSNTLKKLWKLGTFDSLKDYKHSEETRKKISEANSGKKNFWFGKKHSDETKKKIGLKSLGRKQSKEALLKRSNNMKGIKNHFYGRKHTLETRKKISENHADVKGEKAPNWRGGKSFEPYGITFNNALKEKIRNRDNHRCQECFRHQNELRTTTNKKYRLLVHHIDYNKQNDEPKNLISLCRTCHGQTNFKRDDWSTYYTNVMEEKNHAMY